MTDRELHKRIELDATPEQVWAAIATGPGISAWFAPHRVEPREGGTIEQSYGSGYDTTGRVTAWEPGRRFAYGSFEQPEDGRPDYAYEFIVEGRAGGSTVLRFVQSGFLDGADWGGEYDSFDAGWDLFFHNLAQYLAHFAGQRAVTVVTMGYTAGVNAAAAWPVLHRGLGLAGHPRAGDEVTLRPHGPAPITGVVDVANAEFLGVRSAHGLHRIGAEGDAGCGVSAYHYFYGVDVDGPAVTAAWQDWLTGLFPAPCSPCDAAASRTALVSPRQPR